MHLHCLQHTASESPGLIATWTESRNHILSCTRFYAGDNPPGIVDIDALVILGGPMSVHDDKVLTWMPGEKSLIADAIRQKKTVLGICLGAQLVAEALGARVYENPQKEIGVMPIVLTEGAKANPLFLGLPDRLEVFHWHGETFDLPEGAVLLASSEACKNQGFWMGERILSLQFHMEVTEAMVWNMVSEGHDELKRSPFVQSEDAILSKARDLRPAGDLFFKLLDRFFQNQEVPVMAQPPSQS